MDKTTKNFIQYLYHSCGYKNIGILPHDINHYVAICPFVFTHAIIYGTVGNCPNYDNRWCYHSYESALTALKMWDGRGEPQGWHRHPLTGRRRPDGDATKEYINF